MPSRLRQSPRLGVSEISMIWSLAPKSSGRVRPAASAADNSRMPAASSPRPISAAAQSMPSERTPLTETARNSARPGNRAPGRARIAQRPGLTLAAPETTVKRSAAAVSTRQTRSVSARGCGSTALISTTTRPAISGQAGATPSTSRPAMVSCRVSAPVSSGGSTSSRSHCSLNFMPCR